MCGGTEEQQAWQEYQEGLSPRVRGNQSLCARITAYCRSIPACAGEPTIHNTIWKVGKVYPRVCGGTTQQNQQQQINSGLSPRVRGNRLEVYAIGRGYRSIPACAREPGSWQLLGRAATVYPRVCGGTYGAVSVCATVTGLSPRVRGNPARLSRPRPG